MVGVMPSHRRRGILTQLMRRELDDALGSGEPLSILWASEEPIYGRFGYGVATFKAAISADRDRIAFRGEPEPGARVRLIDAEEAARVLPPIWDRVQADRPGVFARSPGVVAGVPASGPRAPPPRLRAAFHRLARARREPGGVCPVSRQGVLGRGLRRLAPAGHRVGRDDPARGARALALPLRHRSHRPRRCVLPAGRSSAAPRRDRVAAAPRPCERRPLAAPAGRRARAGGALVCGRGDARPSS